MTNTNLWTYTFLLSVGASLLFLKTDLFAQKVTKKAGSLFASEELTIESEILDEPREVKVSLPRGYETSKIGYPLLVTLDGEYSFEYTTGVANFLEGSAAIPPMIVVAVSNTDRERDFTPEGLRISRRDPAGDRFLDFLERELLPTISSSYRVDGPKVLAGHSSGGIIASYALATRPELFQAVLALDTPFQLDSYWLHTKLMERAQADNNLPIRMIVTESRFKYEKHWQELVDAAPKKSILARLSIEDETHQSMTFQGLYRGLKTLFAEYRTATDVGTSDEEVNSTFQRLSELYGGPVHPPRYTYMRAIEDCLLQVKNDDADKLLQQMVNNYGESSLSKQFADRIRKSRDAKPLEETVEDLVNSAKATAEEIEPYVGKWKGTRQSVGGAPTELTFDIRVKEGKAIGEIIQTRPDGKEDVQELVVLRVKGDVLELGYMNRMNPRGVLLNSMKLDKDDENLLVGQMTLAGMKFELPDGRKLPRIDVRVERE